MNLGQIRTLVRELIDEPYAGEFPDAALDTFINAATAAVGEEVIHLNPTALAGAPIAVIYPANTAFVDLETLDEALANARAILRIDETFTNGAPPEALSRATLADLDAINDHGYAPSPSGRAYIILGQSIGIVPTPAAAVTLRIFAVPAYDPLDSDQNIPAVPAALHDLAALEAAILARATRDDPATDLRSLAAARRERLPQLLDAATGRQSRAITPALAA